MEHRPFIVSHFSCSVPLFVIGVSATGAFVSLSAILVSVLVIPHRHSFAGPQHRFFECFQGTWERWTGQLDGNGGRFWNQFVAQNSGLVLESEERGFLESKLVDRWVKFLVGLFVFEQVVNEASQFARCSSGGRRSEHGAIPRSSSQNGFVSQ